MGKDKAVVKKGRITVPSFLRPITGYFSGAWREIKQVRWPNRKATWELTSAVLLFTLFWMLIVLGLDIVAQTLLNKLILN